MKLFFLFMLCLLLLSACLPSAEAPAVTPANNQSPFEISTPTAFVAEVKEVEMVTQTPALPTATPDASLPTVDPNLPTPTSTSVGLPKTLEELGIPAVTYRDEVTGFTFDYPADWVITPMPDEDKKTAIIYTVTLRSRHADRGPKQQEGIPPDMAAIDVTVIKNGPKTYEQAVKERRASATTSESGQPVVIQVEEEWTLGEGLQAHRFLYNLGKEPTAGPNSPDKLTTELVTMVNGQMILVSGAGDLSLFNVVAASLREIK